MNAISLYIQTCRYVMKAQPNDADTWQDLYRYLPYLRQSLSCCVCTKVLHRPMGPRESICQHHVCQECIGGKMRLRPSCSWCKDWQEFVENTQLRLIVQCFKKLCDYLASSIFAERLLASADADTSSLLSIIQEGRTLLEDQVLSTSTPELPCVFPSSKVTAKNGSGLVTVKTEQIDVGNSRGEASTAQNDLAEQALSRQCDKSKPKGEQLKQSQPHELEEPSKVTSTSGPEPSDNHVTSSSGSIPIRDHVELISAGSPAMDVTMAQQNGVVQSNEDDADDDEGEDEEEEEETEEDEEEVEDDTEDNQEECETPVRSAQGSGKSNTNLARSYCSSEPSASSPSSPLRHGHIYSNHATVNEHGYNRDSYTGIYSVSMSSDDAPKLKIRRTDQCSSQHRASATVKPCTSASKPCKNVYSHQERAKERKKQKTRRKEMKKSKPKGCRCGLATTTPGKLTCCGQRCPCYSAFKGCLPECRCRGCRNPRKVTILSSSEAIAVKTESDGEDSELEVDI